MDEIKDYIILSDDEFTESKNGNQTENLTVLAYVKAHTEKEAEIIFEKNFEEAIIKNRYEHYWSQEIIDRKKPSVCPIACQDCWRSTQAKDLEELHEKMDAYSYYIQWNAKNRKERLWYPKRFQEFTKTIFEKYQQGTGEQIPFEDWYKNEKHNNF